MPTFQAIVLGVIQGLAEFLPISNSAHLALTPWLLGWEEAGLAFDVALHVGTLLAVLWYFRKEWIRLTMAAIDILLERSIRTEEQRRVLFLIVATIPGGIAGLLLNRYAETIFRSPTLIAINLMVMGGILWIADRMGRVARPLENMRMRDAVIIGLAQIAALVPGVSRSGSTITAGLAMGFTRESAATFSFLMSMPITAAAALFKVPEALRVPDAAGPVLFGIIASAASGWLAIAVLLRYVQRHSYGIFALYRIVLGAAVLFIIWSRV